MIDLTLGQKAKDKVTGFEGIIIGHCKYLTGCSQYSLQPPAKDGEIKPSQWFDEYRIEVTGAGVEIESVQGAIKGGPQRDAPGS